MSKKYTHCLSAVSGPLQQIKIISLVLLSHFKILVPESYLFALDGSLSSSSSMDNKHASKHRLHFIAFTRLPSFESYPLSILLILKSSSSKLFVSVSSISTVRSVKAYKLHWNCFKMIVKSIIMDLTFILLHLSILAPNMGPIGLSRLGYIGVEIITVEFYSIQLYGINNILLYFHTSNKTHLDWFICTFIFFYLL